MYLLVEPSGSRLWRLKYRFAGAERTYAIGSYPEVTLAEAREERDRARGWLKDGKDPVQQCKLERAQQQAKNATTFDALAREFMAAQ
jgi:hypothetical protein